MHNSNSKRKSMITTIVILSALTIVFCVCPAFAAGDAYMGVIRTIVESMTGVIGNIFKVVGILLALYAVGALILAFKNEDPDSKTKASTILVVAIVLIAFPKIVESIGLDQFLQ